MGLPTHTYDPKIQLGARLQCLGQRLWPQMVLSERATPQACPSAQTVLVPRNHSAGDRMLKLGSRDAILTGSGSKQSLVGQEFTLDTIRIASFVFLSWGKLPVLFKIFTEVVELFSHIRSQKLQL